ncbi:dephospho-CoA kinase [Eubacterium sp. 1001713B170207_170306_E7]|uniref:dephospho-CoA kinase n=1 Tax=Eubacterium sp. 1001713B170207_170306_E7 TaxID=2787097 RepID=UPI0018979AF0|nr:dephospho-CoA kinase [Eubacterium sp. 1001713B170207_170306_E7]
MKIIGLTGGIASGKSTVSAIFREDYSLPVIDADLLSREAVLPGSPGMRQIEAAFGPEVILPDGSLNRSRMGGLICDDDAARDRLNSILHPAIKDLYHASLDRLRQNGRPLVIYDCPLLIEAGQRGEVDEVLLVVTDEETRLKRIMQRDGVDQGLAKKKIDIQMPDEKKMKLADTILYNNGTLDELKSCLDFYIKEKLKNACIMS